MLQSESSAARGIGIHPIHKRIHGLKGAHTTLSYMVKLIEEEPEFFATPEGEEYLESVKTRHLPAIQDEIIHLRDELPPDDL